MGENGQIDQRVPPDIQKVFPGTPGRRICPSCRTSQALLKQEEKGGPPCGDHALGKFMSPGSLDIFNHRTSVDVPTIVCFGIQGPGQKRMKIRILVVQDQI